MPPSQWGNPSPIGLLAFIVTTAIDMYVVCGWVEDDFDSYIVSYGLIYGGFIQAVAGLLCLFKGDSYSAALFTLYGGYWMAFGIHGLAVMSSTMDMPNGWAYLQESNGIAGLKSLVGVITFLFWTLSHRKTVILWLILIFVYMLLFVQAAGYATGSSDTKKASGYFGFIAAVLALYSFYAELVNEEYGRHVLPLLKPMFPISTGVSADSIATRLTYDKRANTLCVHFKGLIINSEDDIKTISDAIEKKIEQSTGGGHKVKCIANYEGVSIRKDLVTVYWDTAQAIQKKHYSSIERFNADVFTRTKGNEPLPTMTALRDAAALPRAAESLLEEKRS